ncbi:MAG: RsiV family protein, partial [Anaerovorax sp.]|nr:RsiV family protein [Anaerovorax sp.]
EQIKKEPEIYFDDYETLVVETFNPKNFYCTPEGVVVYYLQYDIAPYSSGIREFLIPYGDCVIDPIKMCSYL